uniref:RNA polymerase II subunit M n=1 Tax=Gasterosteus aculeatus aculeatus TaxID=481459 RepID=A0AAQ4QXJ8_GASAC
MSSSWTGRQGQVGHLRTQSKDELQELILRQEKMLSNKRFLQSLPDKGKKIKEFAEKLRQAIDDHNEEERRQSFDSVARTQLQTKYQQAFLLQQRAIPNSPTASQPNRQSEAAAGDAVPVSAHRLENTSDEQQDQSVSRAAAGETIEMAAAGASLNSDETKEDDLVEALGRVKLSETSSGFITESKDPLNSTARDNYFLVKEGPKTPHYVTVLERTEKTSARGKLKFKPNQLPHRSDVSPSGSSSPSRSSEGSSPLSAQARKERDRKHLDDITAANPPPLHHSPAQLLSLEESADLLMEQFKKEHNELRESPRSDPSIISRGQCSGSVGAVYSFTSKEMTSEPNVKQCAAVNSQRPELQAKLAAQKLSEGLKISMGSYTPDSGPMAAYREVHDEGAQLSSEED